jgi:hypothetical protein
LFLPGSSLNLSKIPGGGIGGPLGFLGTPDAKSFVLFSPEMNDLYLTVFIFKNVPFFSMEEMP